MSDEGCDLEQALAERGLAGGPIHMALPPTRELVIFLLGEGWYALPGGNVREILPCGTIFPLPGLPPLVAGVVLIRGEIASVVRVHALLGVPESQVSRHSAILMGVGERVQSGLLVDRVVDVLEVLELLVHPPPETLPDALRPLVAGELTHLGHLVTLLDLDRLFQAALASRG